MVECAIAKGDDLVASPDARYTPHYYSHKKFPAWFRLASIDEVNVGDFEKRFGPPPKGDGTFFPVWHERSRVRERLLVI